MSNTILTSAEDNSGFLKAERKHLTGEAKWKDIEDLINRWARRNPQGAYLNEQWIKEAKAGLIDKKFAKMGGKADKETGITNRFGVSIHPELEAYILTFYPKFMSTKEDLHEFMRRFPKFTVPESV